MIWTKDRLRRNYSRVVKGHSIQSTLLSAIAEHPSSSLSTPRNLTGLLHAWAQALSSATSPSPKTSSLCADTLNATCTQRPTFSRFPSSQRNVPSHSSPRILLKARQRRLHAALAISPRRIQDALRENGRISAHCDKRNLSSLTVKYENSCRIKASFRSSLYI